MDDDINKEYFIKDKIPPRSLELEEAIIGAMIIDNKGLSQVIDKLFPDIFYKKEHQYIYTAIKKLYNDSNPVDLYTVLNELRINGKLESVGGEYYLIKLTQKVVSSAHIEYHSKIIFQKFILRKLIHILYEVITKCYEDKNDVLSLIDYVESELFDLNQKYLIKKGYETTNFLVKKAIEKMKKTKREGISGIPSGFHKLDYITSGWQSSDLIIIASRPGMGKTTFMLSMVRNIAVKQKIPVVIFSLEMSSIQLMTKLISSETQISSEKIKKAHLLKSEWNSLIDKTERLKNSPIFIDDTPSLDIFDLRAKSRHLISKYNIKLILVDYIQLIGLRSGSKFKNREQEISIISRNLKSISKELNVPIIALSQLSRAVETRGGSKRPLLSDLRESGAIEQDADIVIFIYRPEYYGFKIWDYNDKKNDSCIGEAEIIISKHRNGGLGRFRLKFISDQSKFINIEEKKNISLIWEEDYKKNVIDYEKKLKNNFFYNQSYNNDDHNYEDNLNLDDNDFNSIS
ncbi:replicative DNA helicase [Blattabacterium cuenoti]|uniref:replicative DNA helicase n=1 Tax=Blattabacterium cuenoti TaxID=1653831 RepID=UPI00163CB4AF|nr:replicative DNA helicase [Blattabacterium cuenoti]